jgi:hypothetical protein
MNDALFMRGFERVGDLFRDTERSLQRHGS